MPTLLTGAGDYATAVATSATSLACNKPTNTANGDLLIAYALFRNTGGTITPPSGWTVVNAAESTVFTEGIYYKAVPTASAETPTSYTFSYSGTTARVAIIIARVTGANLSSPIQVAGAWTAGSAGTVTLPSLTATGAGQYIAGFARNYGSTGDATETWGGSLVQALAVTAGTAAITEIFFGQETISAAGATGTRAISTTLQTATAGQGFIIAAHPAPTADAGMGQTVAPSTVTTLSGSGTAFDGATITGYTWSIQSAPPGSTATLSSTSAQNPTITPVVTGTYTLGLVVTDSLGSTSSPDTVTVTVVAAASVNAGPDQSGIEPWTTTVTLAGTSSNGTYAWTQTAGTTVTLSSTSVAGPTFTAPAALAAGETLTFQLSNGAGQTDTVNISILPAVEFWFNGTSQVPTYWRVWNGTTWV